MTANRESRYDEIDERRGGDEFDSSANLDRTDRIDPVGGTDDTDKADEIGVDEEDTGGTGSSETIRFTAPIEWAGYRLDRTIALRLPEHSRALLQRWITGGDVTVDGRVHRPSHKVKAGDEIRVRIPPVNRTCMEPEEIPLDIRYEDDQLLVIVKPKGMVVHPAPGSYTGTLANAVLAHCPDGLSRVGGVNRPGIVHRLDRDTSGLILVAKTDAAHRSLSRQIQLRTVKRRYIAVVWGEPAFREALVDAPIGRHPTDRVKMAVVAEAGEGPGGAGVTGGRAARTEISVTGRFGFAAEIECRLQTGRTHQIRVHCAYIGHPVVGDPIYGGIRRPPTEAFRNGCRRAEFEKRFCELRGQALHAAAISFDHPTTGERLAFTADPPIEMINLLDFLRDSGINRQTS